jgi:CHAT domain-containing protein/tetratricopeptide (TPR) repeat protein
MASARYQKSAAVGNRREYSASEIEVDLPAPRSYLWRMPTPVSPNRLPLLLTLLLALCGTSGAAQESLVTPERPAEYMIYQYPDIELVVRVDIAEAEFGLRVVGPAAVAVKSARVPGRRLGPVFQFIDAVDLPRQLMIEVTPGRPVERSAIGLEVLQFAAGDRHTAALSRAYRMFSLGIETAHSDDTTTWAMKTYSLRNAADLFDQLGMEEMRLWSEYFAAHLVLHRLDDSLMAVELAQDIRRGATRAGFARIELAARVLEGEALLRRMPAAGAGSSAFDHQALHDLLQGTALLAQRLGLASEAGRALYGDGLAFDHQGESQRALGQFRNALDLIAQAGDADLLNQVRGTAATAYEAQGSTSGALDMLDHIAGDLAAAAQDDADLELADRLLEKGRLLNAAYRFHEAQGELERSLVLQRDNGIDRSWGPTGLELAWAYYSQGRADDAVALIRESLPRTPLEGNRKTLARAYGSLANTLRARGRFEQAAQARETQGTLVGEGEGRAVLLFETAMDARWRHGSASREAREMLGWSLQAAKAEGDSLTEARSLLQICLLDAEHGGEQTCPQAAARSAYDTLRDSAVPRLAAEAALSRSRMLHRAGQGADARAELDRLLEELYWYRRFLPGVTGAWYAENRADLAGDYLALTAAAMDERAALEFLLALDRLRAVEAADGLPGAAARLDPQTAMALRELLARREAATGAGALRLAHDFGRQLEAARRSCRQCGLDSAGRLTAGRLRDILSGLDRSEALLTYYLADGGALAVLAGRPGARIFRLGQPGEIRQRLEGLRADLSRPPYAPLLPDLETLGGLLLRPLAAELPEHIYLLPAGDLGGIPFDALRLDGRHLAERHQVVSLASLQSLERRGPALSGDYRDRVFVAGNPQSQRDPFRFEMSRSPEIGRVTDRFVGPGLHVVQGIALRKDEFADARFARAALVHLAIPGVIDLADPSRSRLLLAGAAEAGPAARGDPRGGDSAAGVLTAADLRSFELDADLLLLSATVVTGAGLPPHDGRVPLVSELLDAGAAAVLYSLWPAGDAAAAELADGMYERLQSDPDIVSAFGAVRRAKISNGDATNLGAWAGFQLFIR